MMITVGGLHQGRTSIQSHERPDLLGFENEEILFLEPIDVAADVTRMGFDVYIDCTVTTAAELACGRCLETFRKDLKIRSKMLFVPARQGQKAGTAEGGVYLYREYIDLADRIGEAIREELPMKPLCMAECLGLCPRCGKNRNEADCGCEEKDETYHPFKEMSL
jgi:uncharacterized protein